MIYAQGKEAMVEQLKSKITVATPEQLEELGKILTEHFEKPPEEREFKPQPRGGFRKTNNYKKSPKKAAAGEKEGEAESTEEPKPVAETNGVKEETATS